MHARKGLAEPPCGKQPRRGGDGSRRRDRRRRRRTASRLLQTLLSSGGQVLLYRPQLQHYAVLFGDIGSAHHVAVMVPGVGDGSNLCDDWIPDAREPLRRDRVDRGGAVEGLRQPGRHPGGRGRGPSTCSEDLVAAGRDLTAFVASLALRPDQTLAVVAHSFGSIVTGAALADCGLECTDVVVAGSPGMTVDDLRDLHLEQSHFFSEQAPGDVIAELGVFGTAPDVPDLRRYPHEHRTRRIMPRCRRTPSTSNPGSEALENMVDVVTGQYADIERHRAALPRDRRWPRGLAAPDAGRCPCRMAGRHYRGPGYRLLRELVPAGGPGGERDGQPRLTEVLDESERALLWVAHRVGRVRHRGRLPPLPRPPHATPRRTPPAMPAALDSDPEPSLTGTLTARPGGRSGAPRPHRSLDWDGCAFKL